VVKRTTAAGTYLLDPEFVSRARARLADLQAALTEAEASQASSVEEIAVHRERKERLASELQEVERQLREALRSLPES